MKLVQINVTCGSGSTGKICVAISQLLNEINVENYVLYASGNSTYPQGKKYMTSTEIKLQALKSRVLGNYGFNSRAATRRLISMLDDIGPQIVHLHNLHGHNCDLRLLLSYLKEKKIKVVWTFHDCWAFTGYCPYFDLVRCERWKDSCQNCPQRKKYSWFFDRSRRNMLLKKHLLKGLDLTIVTPSRWLADITKASFLQDYPVKVIHNGINLDVFQPVSSDFRQKYRCEDKFILLGVAFDWSERKGLDVFNDLAHRLDDRFQIVLVGVGEDAAEKLPGNIITIRRTQNQQELAQIYTAADLFVIPTREENYPTVNMEALACGTPVVTFRTGGSPEMLDATCGAVAAENNADALLEQILRIAAEGPYTTEACLAKSREFDEKTCFPKYVDLYQELLNGSHP